MRLRSGAIVLLISLVVAVFSGLAIANDAALVGTAAGVVTLLGLVAWWVLTRLVYGSYGWALTDGTVEMRFGVIVKRHQVLPRTRVQNVTQSAGPVARWLGLASVVVHSAGANTPNIRLPDVNVETGESLRASLLPAALT